MESVKRYNQTEIRYATGEVADMAFVNSQDFDRIKAEYSSLLGEHEDLIEKFNNSGEAINSLEQRRHAEQQACQAAERRVDELEGLFERLIKAVTGMADYIRARSRNLHTLQQLGALDELVKEINGVRKP